MKYTTLLRFGLLLDGGFLICGVTWCGDPCYSSNQVIQDLVLARVCKDLWFTSEPLEGKFFVSVGEWMREKLTRIFLTNVITVRTQFVGQHLNAIE